LKPVATRLSAKFGKGLSRPRSCDEIETARESWSVRQQERQVGALLFDRLAKIKRHRGT